MLVCCALDRIWSSTQRLEDLDWSGPEMPYVQYGGWCSCSIALEPRCSKFRGELTSWSSSVEPVGVQPIPMWGAFPFIVQGGAPIYIYLALCFCTVGVRFVLVSRRGPLGRSGVGRLDPGDLLGHLGACTEPVLAGTPVRRRGALGVHVPGHRHGSNPGC